MNASNAKDYLPLVQALADGKVIQHRFDNEGWYDREQLDFSDALDNYRIKPEPKEIWVNEYESGDSYDKRHVFVYESEQKANDSLTPEGVTRHYREVIE